MAKKKRKGRKARSRQRQRQRHRQIARARAAEASPEPSAKAPESPAEPAEPEASAHEQPAEPEPPAHEQPAEPEPEPEPAAAAADRDSGSRRRRAPQRSADRGAERRKRSRYEQSAPPPGAFLKGALLGCVAGIPLFAALSYALAALGLRSAPASFEYVFAVVAALCGLPLLLSAGGVGRLAARAAIAPGKRAPVIAAALASGRALAVGGVGIVLIALIALGGFPLTLRSWALAAGAGILGGAALGAVIGAWAATGGDSREEVGETTAE